MCIYPRKLSLTCIDCHQFRTSAQVCICSSYQFVSDILHISCCTLFLFCNFLKKLRSKCILHFYSKPSFTHCILVYDVSQFMMYPGCPNSAQSLVCIAHFAYFAQLQLMHLTLNLFGYSHNCITVCCFVQLQSLVHTMLCLCSCSHQYIPCCVCATAIKITSHIGFVQLQSLVHPMLDVCNYSHCYIPCCVCATAVIITSHVVFVQLQSLLHPMLCLCNCSHQYIPCCVCATAVISTSHVVFGVCATADIITKQPLSLCSQCVYASTVIPRCVCNCIPCFVYMQEQSLLLHLMLILCNCHHYCVACASIVIAASCVAFLHSQQ